MSSSTNDTDASAHKVVVLGAGYAGVLAANRILSSLHRDRSFGDGPSCRITVVNPRPDFVERIRLHEVAAGTRDSASTPLSDVLHPEARLIVGSAKLIDPDEHVVEVVVDGTVESIWYDTLIYAAGSATANSVPGVDRYAYRVGDVDSAHDLRAALGVLPAHSRVQVVGGGATAVETASEIAWQYPELDVVIACSGEVLGVMPNKARRKIVAKLTALGVYIREHTAVTEVSERAISTANGDRLEFDLCVWTASFAVPDIAYRSGLATDEIGRLRVDATLTCIDNPDIVGAGDAVVTPPDVGAHLRMGCATALPLGAQAAQTVLARLRGEQPAPMSIGFVAQCISLGRKAGVIQFVHADDSPRSAMLSGRLGASVKESICKMTLRSLIKEQTRPGAYRSPKGPTRAPLPETTTR
ncbi:NAD(P)/FAD-dependent oxidoreductase [Antrihabitans cavernicola]|uniref:FAD/NAD(P)-binding domain-containing protein n=1 Tax=Antrihabitans cavernicola TaxID=2495913 RepID=A0A5A7SC38_9NOCA|nr:FAD-dependent oxidoreductase [Spelaeibacter cavernicola]KAA0022153.1 hypothetical protein FOY51_14215 [Spelaeibacter cavernicola]